MNSEQLAVGLDAVADTLIPPTGDWPSPSALLLGQDLLSRLRDREIEIVSSAVEHLNAPDAFTGLNEDERVARVEELETSRPGEFDVFRRCVYFAYYAQPAVVRILRTKGFDVNEAPQPTGYSMEPFAPEHVSGVDRGRVVWIPAEKVGMTLRTAS